MRSNDVLQPLLITVAEPNTRFDNHCDQVSEQPKLPTFVILNSSTLRIPRFVLSLGTIIWRIHAVNVEEIHVWSQ